MNTQAIILAGGLGTRLRSAVPDLPKCMAPVAGKPFLHYVIDYLQKQGITDIIFSLGYLHEIIENFVQLSYPNINSKFSIEIEPLGTGGAIKLACGKASSENVLVLNGDTMYKANIDELLKFHIEKNASCTLALKPMANFDRYGVVEMDQDNFVRSFKEKKFYKEGLINGGVYALNVHSFINLQLPLKFSFEKGYLEKYYADLKMRAIVQDAYFIDIGIPEDFEKANVEFGSEAS